MKHETSADAHGAFPGSTVARRMFFALMLFATTSVAQTGASPQKVFSSPEAGASALVEAVKANDESALREILGRRGVDLIGLRKPSSDRQQHERFLAAYQESNKLVPHGDARMVLEVGKDAWPFPIPLVKEAEGWRFDARLGEQEALARRIGRNELAAIQVCLAIADSQREYASVDRNGNGVLEYAPKFVSTAGKHDGLYWESASGESLSPLGPFVAAAGIDSGAPRIALERASYQGYFYRILAQQGKNAKGGAYSYIVRGRMIGGFAVVAYPARYGYTGVKSFMINHDGEVYEKDLGKNTEAIAKKIRAFDPDPSWKRP
ncbi:MAG: DUF2950 domain-containing protein [Burkholderiales bacterium]